MNELTRANRDKVECIHGHPFTAASTYIRPSNGSRICRVCAAIRTERIRFNALHHPQQPHSHSGAQPKPGADIEPVKWKLYRLPSSILNHTPAVGLQLTIREFEIRHAHLPSIVLCHAERLVQGINPDMTIRTPDPARNEPRLEQWEYALR